MEMSGMSMEKCQGQIQQKASNFAIRKSRDQVEEDGEFNNKITGEENKKSLELAAQPYLGVNINLKV
ncbi:putative motility protein [Niallia oryzisoli]|uniref:putative motility protein n=1 Tax=Niallia oryzisoli TaxID=1737571 RepID=UPI0037364FC0